MAANTAAWQRTGARWLVPSGVAVAVLALFAPEFAGWWREWQEPDGFYTHGPVVPVLAAALIWLDWPRLKRIAPRPSLAGLILVLPALALLTMSRWSSIFFIAGFAWLMFLPGMVWMVHGAALARALLAPIGLMLFQLPMPAEVIEPISLPIQELSIAWATRYLNLALLPAERDSTLIHLPNYTMDVGIQCSGFKLLVGLLTFGAFLAAAHQGAWWRKALLVLSCIPLAAIVNAARIAVNGIVGETISFHAGYLFHEYAGIFVWSMSFVGLFLGMAVLRCNRLKGTGSS
jgi:exosortase